MTAGSTADEAGQARLSAMSPAKRALFEKRLRRRHAQPDDTIVPVPRTGEIPLSSAQRRLWFMDQLSPGSPMFNLPIAVRLTGTLRLDVLTAALHTLIARHESLRTVFAAGADGPVQRILPRVDLDLTPIPLDPATGLEATLAAEAARPFALEQGPLVRATLIRLGDDDHVLALTMHHSVCDGLSVGIVVGDLLELYRSGATGTAAELAETPVQYADYAVQEPQPSAADLDYWSTTLAGAPPVADLPLDHPRPEVQSFRGACHRFTVPASAWKSVQQLAIARRTTPYVVLLAGFAALLSRYCPDDEVCVATPVANRPRVELENVVGFFTNSIVLRVGTAGDPTFAELVDRARDVVQNGLARSGVPFERVVEAVDPPRSLGHAPIAQVSFALVDDPVFDLTIDGLRIRPVELHTGAAKYDLTVELWPGADDRLHGTLEYATDLFEATTAARLMSDLGLLLDTVAAEPGTRLASAGVTGRRDRDRAGAHVRRRAEQVRTTGFTAPATPVEETIAAVWAEVLGLPAVSRDANFARLGGHSLLATRAVARLRDTLGIDLPLRVFLRADTLADLAMAVERLRNDAPRPSIVATPHHGPAPLSYAQGRLYFLHRLAEDSSFYNVPVTFRLDGRLDRDAFRRAFAALWERHEGLRTRFPAPDGEPTQEILPASAVPYEEVDLPEGAEAFLAEQAARPFDLANGPLARGVLARLAPDAHLFAVTLHHAVSDGWSVSVLLDELITLYRAFATGAPSPLEPLPITYLDYTHWQRSWLAGPELETQLDYWRKQLREVPVLQLPTDRPRPAVQTYRGARHRFSFPAELARSVGDLGRREGASLFMVLLAGFDVLLARTSGQRDITVGTPAANRPLTELEGLVGCFANTLALRVDLSGDPSFTEVLRRVRQTAQDAYAHQDTPFDLVVDAVAPERSLSHSPLFQVRFAVQTQPREDPDPGAGLSLTMLHEEQETARFDLLVDVWETAEGLEGYVEYSTDLFDPDTVAALTERYRTLLTRLTREPDRDVFDVDPLSAAEYDRLEALSRGADLTDGVAFVHRFHAQAARRPDAPAVNCGDVTLTYGELRRRAGALARVLAARGVGPESLVGLYLERGADLVVAILAVHEAGGAYLPLDPAYPADRTTAIVRDARPALVLTSRALAVSAPAGALTLEDTTGLPGADPSPAEPSHPAYVVYTSGTSGSPKGVVLTHGGLAGYLSALPAALGLPAEPAVLHTASFAFSSSVRQLAIPLALGGRVVIAGRDHLTDPDRLLAYAAEHDVDVLDLVPSYLRAAEPALARGGWRPRVLLTASEPLLADLPEAIRRAPGEPPELINMYGQTETTGIVATAPVATEREGRGAVVPLGRPIPGARIHVVDDRLRPVPPGQPGEIVVGGTGLARGYLGDPALTAARFVPDPFGPPGARLYRTGDRGRFLPSGKLEFLGRTGDQVKIRGHRVEPQEVTAVLSTMDGVAECAVLCVEEGADERRLVAYPVLRGAATASGLRAALKERLPAYMVPALEPVDALPRLPNGKVDREALIARGRRPEPSPAAAANDSPSRFAETLTTIWQEILHRTEVGRTDDFFELGGDSLHVIRVIDRARKAGMSLTPAQFIANPTIAGLAAVATARAGAARKAGAATVAQQIPLLPTHQAFLRREFADQHLYTHVFMFEPAEPIDPVLMEEAVKRLIAHHETLRFSFPRDGEAYRVAVREPFDPAPFTSVDLSALDPAAQDVAFRRLDRTLHRKLDYGNGPLLQFALVRFGAGRPDRFVAIVHHQLMDNSSWGILLDDLQDAYTALAAGTEPALTPPTGTFREWARGLAELARSTELDADIAYWTRIATRPVPRLPLDFPDGGNQMPLEDTVTLRLGEADTAALRRVMPRRYALSLNDALLAAVLRGYADWSGQDAVLLDMVARGRELGPGDLDLSRAVGRFSVTAPRLLTLPAEDSTAALLGAVAEAAAAMPRGGLGYGLLRYLGGFPAIGALLAPLGEPDILLSNWGELDQIFDESTLLGPPAEDVWRSPGNGGAQPDLTRMHRLVINAGITGGELELNWRYSTGLHRRESIERLGGLVLRTLTEFARAE